MNAKSSSKRKTKPALPKARSEAVKQKKSARSLEEVVGAEVYRTWVTMLYTLVPDGRTHRLAPLVAAMLQYALVIAEDKRNDDLDEGSIALSLLSSTEASDPSEVKELIHDVVTKLFKDARVEFSRTSSRGYQYSIADDAYAEYIHWYDMPWE